MKKVPFIKTQAKGLSSGLLAGLACLFLLFTASLSHAAATPAGTVIDNQADVIFTDANGNSVTIYSNTVEVVVQAPVIIGTLTKSASTNAPAAGSTVTFTLAETVLPLAGIDVTVDGNAQNLDIIRDTIPANTVFSAFVNSGGAEELYHVSGQPEQTYTETEPANASTIDAVAFGLPGAAGGAAVTVAFNVLVNANAAPGTVINNTGQIFYNGGPAGGDSSNTVTLNVATPASIAYYSGSTFTNTVSSVALVGTLYVQADAAACNTNPGGISNIQITLATSHGDFENYTATNSLQNPSVFTIYTSSPGASTQWVTTANAAVTGIKPYDGTLEVYPNDVITATLSGCGYAAVSANVLVDPLGVVFDSSTGAAISNATVTLWDDAKNAPATVYQFDGITNAPATVTTGPYGSFQFPMVPPSTYKFIVTAPNGHSFPSRVSASQLEQIFPAMIINSTGSYGRDFRITGSSLDPVLIDIPLDPAPLSGFFIEKTGSTKTAEIGDFVGYTIAIKNNSGAQLANAVVTDHLPAGFVYVGGTARLDGAKIPDPTGAPGLNLQFQVGTMNSGGSHTLTYRIRIGPGAVNGNGTNTAIATAANGTTSNESQWQVTLTGGVFSDKGIIFGKVFADCNGNKIQDKGEPGIPGVAVYMEDGTFAITDSEGKYSIYGIDPATHALKVDNTTLPQGATLEVLTNRNAGDPGSVFVDLKAGDMHRADFAVRGCQTGLMDQVAARKKLSGAMPDEAFHRMNKPLDPNAAPIQESASLPTSKIMDSGVTLPDYKGQALSVKKRKDDDVLPDDGELDSFDPDRLKDMDNSLDFIDLNNGDVLPYSQTNIVVKGKIGIFKLTVNGTDIPQNRVGLRSTLNAKELEAWEYIGINLKPGVNELKLAQYDQFGNKRGEKTIKVTAPGPLARIRINLPKGDLKADGRSAVPVTVELLDGQGLPVLTKTALTLKVSGGGSWQTAGGPGKGSLQLAGDEAHVSIDGGKGQYMLLSPRDPGDSIIDVEAGDVKSESKVFFGPNLRPMMAVGVVEGVLDFSRLDPSHIVPARQGDGFEDELKNIAFSSDNGKLNGGARGALYLVGKVKGDYLLTLAYDSNKEAGQRLFRDIQPDEFYPVYGDSSIRGYDAQSTGKLYVRVDKGKSFILYGDFTTGQQNEIVKLGAYSRSLNGTTAHYENKKVSVSAFGSQNTSKQVVDEMPANGTSGPFQLSNTDITENSEQVEIITRDRNQPSLILSDVPQTRFTDYELDPLTGRLLFKAPVPSVDENLNPVSIRVTYEVDQGGNRFWTTGAQVQAKVINGVQVGGSFVKDFDPQDKTELESANSMINIGKNTYVIGEVARMVTSSSGLGGAERVELVHESAGLKARVDAVRTGLDFNNPSSGISAGRFDATGHLEYSISNTGMLVADMLHNQDLSTGGRQDGVYAGYRRMFRYLTAELGLRYAKESVAPAETTAEGTTPFEYESARLKISGQIPKIPKLGLTAEYEQALTDLGEKNALMGADYQLPGGKVYVRHEFLSSLEGPYALNGLQQLDRTVFGIDTGYMKGGSIYSEYKVNDAVDGRDAEAAIGLKNLWTPANGLQLNTSLERTQQLGGPAANGTSTSVTGALGYTANPRWKGTARLEGRLTSTDFNVLNTLGLAWKINCNLTFLGRNLIDVDQGKHGGATKTQEWLQMGMAYRPAGPDVWNALAKYELKYDKDGSAGTNTLAHIVSANVNYSPVRPLVISGKYAGKLVLDNSYGLQSVSNTHMLGLWTTYDINSHWDAGIMTSALFTNLLKELQYGAGVEVGYLVEKNVWLSAGYNVFGFKDKDLAAEDYTNPGVYMRLRMKFDEGIFSMFSKKKPGDEKNS